MAFGSFNTGANNQPMAEINVIPLVDVMLVLLVIFIITAPLLTHQVKIDLPRATSAPNVVKAEKIQLAIDAQGQVFWNGETVSRADLVTRLRAAGTREPAPELHVHADADARYATVAEVLSEAAKAKVTKIGFVTDPSAAP